MTSPPVVAAVNRNALRTVVAAVNRNALRTVVAVTATALAFAAIAIVAGRVGPLTAHPRAAPAPPAPVSLAPVPPQPLLPPPVGEPQGAGGSWLWWIVAGLAVLALVAVGWWLVLVFRRPPRPTPMASSASPAQLIGSMLGGLAEPAAAELGDGRTFLAQRAADDIIASWEIVENAAAACGLGRRAAATPTEFIRDAVAAAGDAHVDSGQLGHGLAHGADAARVQMLLPGRAVASTVLLTLYHHARFDTAALAPGSATAARAAARSLVERWEQSQRQRSTSEIPADDGHGAAPDGRHQ